MIPLQKIKSASLLYPINRVAKAALIKLKESLQINQLHVFQLMEWAINSQKAMQTETLETVLLRLQQIQPAEALKLIWKDVKVKRLPTNPEELALSLIYEVEAWILETIPDYPSEVRHMLREQQ